MTQYVHKWEKTQVENAVIHNGLKNSTQILSGKSRIPRSTEYLDTAQVFSKP